jgi:hypothetical protein
VSIGTVNFDDQAEDTTLTTYEGLVCSNWKASSSTSPAAPSALRAGVPTITIPPPSSWQVESSP